MFTPDQVLVWIETYKYFILLPVSILEGPIITVLGGFLSSLGYLNVYVTFLVVIAGDLIGDTLYYAIGRFGRNSFIERYGKHVGITEGRVMRIERHFEEDSFKSLMIGKFTHAIGGVILVAAGIAKMPFWQFLGLNLLFTIPKSIVFLLIGYYFGQIYAKIDNLIAYMSVILLIIGAYLIYRLFNKAEKRT